MRADRLGQRVEAEFVRELREGIQQRTELNRKYCDVIHKNIELLEQNTALVVESTRLKQIMYAAPALTAAAEAGMERVEELERCWTQPAGERLQ